MKHRCGQCGRFQSRHDTGVMCQDCRTKVFEKVAKIKRREKHEWKYIDQGIAGVLNLGKRRCTRCGAEQTRHAEHRWMRVTGYRWLPLVGRCVPHEEKASTGKEVGP